MHKANEMNQEFVELKTEHWLTTEELRNEREQLQKTKTENQRLKQENDELHKQLGNSVQPNYEALRDRVLGNWRVKKGAESKDRIKEALDKFIRELHNEVT